MSEENVNLEKIVETLSTLSVLDLANLKKMLEDKWGVEAAAPVAVAAGPAAAGGAAPAAEEEASEFNVILKEFDAAKKVPVIKAIREVTGLGLGDARAILDNTPKELKTSVSKAEAEEIKKKLEEAGGKVELQAS